MTLPGHEPTIYRVRGGQSLVLYIKGSIDKTNSTYKDLSKSLVNMLIIFKSFI